MNQCIIISKHGNEPRECTILQTLIDKSAMFALQRSIHYTHLQNTNTAFIVLSFWIPLINKGITRFLRSVYFLLIIENTTQKYQR